MTVAALLPEDNLRHVIAGLLGRNVVLEEVPDIDLHEATMRGLVTDEDELVGLIGCDLAFAHLSGAALAMIPAASVTTEGEAVNEEWLEFYVEVANVMSRVVNETSVHRLRIDPGIDHSSADLVELARSTPGRAFSATIEGYGTGVYAIWTKI